MGACRPGRRTEPGSSGAGGGHAGPRPHPARCELSGRSQAGLHRPTAAAPQDLASVAAPSQPKLAVLWGAACSPWSGRQRGTASFCPGYRIGHLKARVLREALSSVTPCYITLALLLRSFCSLFFIRAVCDLQTSQFVKVPAFSVTSTPRCSHTHLIAPLCAV